MSGLDVGNFSLSLTGRAVWNDPYLHPLPTALIDWGSVSYTYVNDSYLRGTDGAVIANASYRHTIITVESYWQAVKVAGVYNIGTSHYFCTFYNSSDVKIGHYLQGTGANVTLDPAGNGVIPIPAGTAKIGLNQLKVNTAFTVSALNTRVLMIGDSTSIFGSTGIGDDMATLMPTRTFYQQGIGGQYWFRNIRYRMGIVPFTMTVTAGIIPSSGAAVVCTLPSTQSILKHTSTNVVCKIRINGLVCALRYTQVTDSYTIAALDTIGADMSVGTITNAQVVSSVVYGASPDVANCAPLNEMLSSKLWIVRSCPSINDKWIVNYPQMEADLDILITYASRYGANLLLCGLMNGQKDLPSANYTGGEGTSAAQSQNWLEYVDTMNAYIATLATTNDHIEFVDIQAHHIANNGSTVENINGINYNVLTDTAISPKLSDKRHETTTVQSTETAPFVKSAISALGW